MVGGLVWALTQGITLKEPLGWGVASGAATATLSGAEVDIWRTQRSHIDCGDVVYRSPGK